MSWQAFAIGAVVGAVVGSAAATAVEYWDVIRDWMRRGGGLSGGR